MNLTHFSFFPAFPVSLSSSAKPSEHRATVQMHCHSPGYSDASSFSASSSSHNCLGQQYLLKCFPLKNVHAFSTLWISLLFSLWAQTHTHLYSHLSERLWPIIRMSQASKWPNSSLLVIRRTYIPGALHS